ncbi:MAG: FHA domain-containing protein [Elusimicrobia bacterium]|nr:FHA domain-containing protein [Elusimicrobiota bacterium]
MIQLKSDSSFSFYWRTRPPQWRLSGIESGQKTALIRALPFIIGRAEDCHLILPDSVELRKTTSRWHCHISEKGGKYFINDGSFGIVPETGAKKPSVSGTFRNGQRITGPEELKPGDSLAIGHWNFRVEKAKNFLIDIDDVLETVQSGKRSTLKPKGRESHIGYRRLHDLLMELSRFENMEDSLSHLLAFAAKKIPAAQALAILSNDRGAAFSARLAWKKDFGRLFDFKFSSSLLERLHVSEPFLLEQRISDPTTSQKFQNITSALLVPLRGWRGKLGALYMDNRKGDKIFTEDDLYLATALGGLISLQLMTEKQIFLCRLEENLKQYFSSNVVRRLVEEAGDGKLPELTVTKKTAAILFVDINGFSEFCRANSPEEISGLLNPYFRLMSECVHRYGGYVDKFIGDAVMGVFEAAGLPAEAVVAGTKDNPEADSLCSLRAVRAARDMIKVWRGWTNSELGKAMPLRIGIDTGRVVIGNIGFSGRMEYTALGDTVNLAARLQKLAGPDGIALSDAGRLLIEKEFRCEDGGEREVKGFGTVKVWDIKG